MLAEVLFNIICNKSDDQIKKIHSRIFLSASINRLLFLPYYCWCCGDTASTSRVETLWRNINYDLITPENMQ